jgi:hypothetical protein
VSFAHVAQRAHGSAASDGAVDARAESPGAVDRSATQSSEPDGQYDIASEVATRNRQRWSWWGHRRLVWSMMPAGLVELV